jgi:hypothetical protein
VENLPDITKKKKKTSVIVYTEFLLCNNHLTKPSMANNKTLKTCGAFGLFSWDIRGRRLGWLFCCKRL